MAKAIGIDHMAIYVSDMEAAKKFFVEGLGLIPDGDYGDEFFMKIGKQKIAVFQGDNEDQTINHLAVNVDNFEEIMARLQKMGYRKRKRDGIDGPNGIRIQLVSED